MGENVPGELGWMQFSDLESNNICQTIQQTNHFNNKAMWACNRDVIKIIGTEKLNLLLLRSGAVLSRVRNTVIWIHWKVGSVRLVLEVVELDWSKLRRGRRLNKSVLSSNNRPRNSWENIEDTNFNISDWHDKLHFYKQTIKHDLDST